MFVCEGHNCQKVLIFGPINRLLHKRSAPSMVGKNQKVMIKVKKSLSHAFISLLTISQLHGPFVKKALKTTFFKYFLFSKNTLGVTLVSSLAFHILKRCMKHSTLTANEIPI